MSISWPAKAICIVLLLISAGCADSQTTSVEVDPGGVNTSVLVPGGFGGVVGGRNVLAATSDFLVGFGGSVDVPDLPGVRHPLLDGELVDLSDGVVRPIKPLLFEGEEVRVASGAANNSEVVVIGEVCSTVSDEGLCGSREMVSSRLDPASGEWAQMHLPDKVAGTIHQYSTVQVLSDGRFIAVVRLIPSQGSMLLESSGTRWRLVRIFDSDNVLSECATDSAFYRLYKSGAATEKNQADDPAASVLVSLEKTDLKIGSTTNIDLPELASGFGGAGLKMACGPDTVVVASGTPATEGRNAVDTSVQRLTSKGWLPVRVLNNEKIAGQMFPGEAVTGPRGVLVGGRTASVNSKAAVLEFSGVASDGQVTKLDSSQRTDGVPIWKGLSGTVLIIKNATDLDTETVVTEIKVWP
ncbi:MAG: hypothetical protein KDA95_04935 [Acidimicrobiales bacterium]|nr:hypothetical protein [Acidimicrobiales bacterium]